MHNPYLAHLIIATRGIKSVLSSVTYTVRTVGGRFHRHGARNHHCRRTWAQLCDRRHETQAEGKAIFSFHYCSRGASPLIPNASSGHVVFSQDRAGATVNKVTEQMNFYTDLAQESRKEIVYPLVSRSHTNTGISCEAANPIILQTQHLLLGLTISTNPPTRLNTRPRSQC